MWVLKSHYLKVFFVIALIMTSIFSWCSLEILPEPKSLNADTGVFSAARAHKHVKRMTQSPRRLGSTAHENSKNFLLGELAQLGCNVFIQKTFSSTSFRIGVFAGPVENILCLFKGKKEESVLLMSHYDSVHLSPGAGDAASGVSIILETARTLKQSQHENSLLILFTDGEETGLLGAAAFVKSELHKKYKIQTILNFEARGNSGPFALFETHNFNAISAAASKEMPTPIGNSFMDFLYQFLPNETDLSVFKSQNVSAMNFAFARGLEHYHKSSDTAENLSLESLQHAGESAVTTTRYLLNTNLSKVSQSPKVLYQDLFGKIHLSYPPLLIKILAVIMALLLSAYLILKAPKSLITASSIAIVALYFFLLMWGTTLVHSLIVQIWTSNSVITDFYLFFAAFAAFVHLLAHLLFLKIKKILPELHYGLCFFLLIFVLLSFISVELGSLIVWSSLGVCLYCFRGNLLTRGMALIPMAVLLPEFLHSALIADSGTQFVLPTFVLFFSALLLHILFGNPYKKTVSHSSSEISDSTILDFFHLAGIATGLILFVFLSFKHGFEGSAKRAEFFEILSEDKLYVAVNKSKKITTLFNQKVDSFKQDYLLSHLSRWRIKPRAFDVFETGATLARSPVTLFTQWGQTGAPFSYMLDIPVQDYECVHLLMNPEIPIFDLKVNGQSPYFVTRKKYASKDPPGPEFIESCSLRNVPLRLEFKSHADQTPLRELLAIFTQNTEAPSELRINPKSTIMSFFSNTLFVLKKIAL